MSRALRYDLAASTSGRALGRIDLARRRFDGGGLAVMSTPAPADAILTYPTGREFRPASEVFGAPSLATWEGLPVIRGHFDVTMANVRDDAIGYVRGATRGDGWVNAELVILDADSIDAIERGDLVELSGGYTVDLLPTPGSFRGEKYDAVQTSIRMLHLAVGPRDWARAGAGARIVG